MRTLPSVLELQIRAFGFVLTRPLQTAAGVFRHRRGWLLKLKSVDGRIGWGEVAPLTPAEMEDCSQALRALPRQVTVQQLEELLPLQLGPVAFALGAALAELDALVGTHALNPWLSPPPSAWLLPAGKAMLAKVDQLIEHNHFPMTLKWKVATFEDDVERRLLEALLERLPSNASLRLDANGGWNRVTAWGWMQRVARDPRLSWLEQPLPPKDQAGIEALGRIGAVALDESLVQDPGLRARWKGWQVRRPLLEGDPRPLLRQLEQGIAKRMVSTVFETGIGRRWLHHLAALQWKGPTPSAPGLAPGWCPDGPLFSTDPEKVWSAAQPW